MSHPWLAQRTSEFDSSGIRKVFDLAAKMKNPINLSIGQPDFPVPDAVKDAAIAAIRGDRNGYSVTQGIPQLRDELQKRIDAEYGHSDRRVLVTSGTSGAIVMALLAMVDPGDEVIFMDPYFALYPALVKMAGGKCVIVDCEADFSIDVTKIKAAITPKTKMILLNSPANPTGVVAGEASVKELAELAAERNIALLSDEIYRTFTYEGVLPSPTTWNDQTLVVDGFSKTYGVTGWRMGWIHGPAAIIDKLTMLQQYTFVCAPHPLQYGGIAALDTDMSGQVAEYRKRRDFVVDGLRDAGYEVAPTGGAFYVFPRVPKGYANSTEFVAKAIEKELLIIPGHIFSRHDTHFRISYAASWDTLERGLAVLRELAKD